MKKTLIIALILLIKFSHIYGQSTLSQRKVVNLNENWFYLEDNNPKLSEIQTSDSWLPISLPHSWNSFDATDVVPGYRRDASWYKKILEIENLDTSKRYVLYFEGSNITTKVYVNEQYAGEHVGGYLGFDIEITKFLKPQGKNEILVKVDNAYDREIIPSQKADFFIFGGITRDVWLKTLSQEYIEKVHVNTPDVSNEMATTEVSVQVNGEIEQLIGKKIKTTLLNPKGEKVTSKTQTIDKSNFNGTNLMFSLKTVKKPQLWSIENPQLYTVQVELLEENAIVDKQIERFGYRWFEFKDYGAFYLNGERVLLRGTHRHEEFAGYGAAMPNELHRKDMQIIKDMGANFVRLAHYPQDPEIYKACDELGILVWDELPWCRGGIGNEKWKQNTTRLLKEMISQNRNHPSIILWSLGNEIYWLPDFENGDDREKINEYLSEINALSHQLDPSRPTGIRKYYEGADLVDVFSPSIWSGWYSGTYTNYEKAVANAMKEYPHFLHVEYGGSSMVGRHTENPIDGQGQMNPDEWEEAVNQVAVKNIAKYGDWSENYIVDLFDWHLRISETTENFVGNAQWAIKDFGTPLRPANDIPYINQKGLVDREGIPKDAYYVFKSYWSDQPFCYIESHTWTERSGPEDLERNICVYSSCEEVKFILNGVAREKKKKDINNFPASGLNWDLNFKEGKNQLIALGYKNGKQVAADTLVVNYSFKQNGSPTELILNYTQLDNGNLLIEALAIDKNGHRCLDYKDRVYFQCLQGGKALTGFGTATKSESIKMANGKAAIEVAPNNSEMNLIMEIRNQDFKGSYLTIRKNELSAIKEN
jgi:beta-galactosidase